MKKKRHSFSRTTISVPHNLKKRMKRAGSKVNWSAVACESFEAKLDELGPVEEIATIEEAVERLNAAQAEAQTPENEEKSGSNSGLEAGRHWALNLASIEQLTALSDFHDEVTPDKWEELIDSREGWFELTRRIATDEALAIEGLDECEPLRHGRRHRRLRGLESGRNRHRPGPSGQRRRARKFWQMVLHERPGEPGFFAGFANGALQAWQEIKPQLDSKV